jgi:sterol desaturase/sphingolipid hydroxylase (fatty acid hydroxylase superfamily)
MDWLASLGGFWLNLLAWLTGLAVVFGILVRLMPCNPGMYWWKDLRAVGADFMYWFIVPVFLNIGRTLMLIAGVILLFGGREPGFAALREQPLWLQCLEILVVKDVMQFAIHILFHTRLAWKFHAVHHSPAVLDWTSSARFHPVNNLLEFTLSNVAVLLMGFAPAALVVLAPIDLIYAAMVHANLNWTFGPLRYVFASPVFHRWHHTLQQEGLDKNFASTFPILDVMFGTFYMPAGKLPEHFGTGEADFPDDFWGQFAHPFRPWLAWARRRPILASAAMMLALAGALGGLTHFAPQLTALAEQQTGQTEQARLQSPPEERPIPALAPDLAIRSRTDKETRSVCSVALSADGQNIISGNRDGTMKVWESATALEKRTLSGHRGTVSCLALSADERRLVSGSHDQTVKVWDPHSGLELFTFVGHAGAVLAVAISADGRRVASAGADGTAKVWDAVTGREVITLPRQAGAIPGVAISPDGRRVVLASGETAKVYDAETGRETLTLEGHSDLVLSVAIGADGKRILSGGLDERIKVWDAETGGEKSTLTGHACAILALAISADGRRIVSGGVDGTAKVWDAATGQEKLLLTRHNAAITGVAIDAAGRYIASCSRDGIMKLWDTAAGKSEKLTRR